MHRGGTPNIFVLSENLRTLVEFDNTLCFPLAAIFCGKFLTQHWLQLLAIIFCRQAKKRLLDKHNYTFEKPVTVIEAVSVVHQWSCTNMGGDRPQRRTVWKYRRAIFGLLTRPPDKDLKEATGKRLITQPKIKPNHLSWITYDSTDILQTPCTVVLCCPADSVSNSTMTRYVVREFGHEQLFKQSQNYEASPIHMGTMEQSYRSIAHQSIK